MSTGYHFENISIRRNPLGVNRYSRHRASQKAGHYVELGVSKRVGSVLDHAYAPVRVYPSLRFAVNLDHEHGIPMLPVTIPEGSSCNLNDCDTQQMSLGLGQQHRLTRSVVSVGSIVCRICHTNTSKEPLVSPCR